MKKEKEKKERLAEDSNNRKENGTKFLHEIYLIEI
jgi:hypothetical protein